jgi:hypothetical protein
LLKLEPLLRVSRYLLVKVRSVSIRSWFQACRIRSSNYIMGIIRCISIIKVSFLYWSYLPNFIIICSSHTIIWNKMNLTYSAVLWPLKIFNNSIPSTPTPERDRVIWKEFTAPDSTHSLSLRGYPRKEYKNETQQVGASSPTRKRRNMSLTTLKALFIYFLLHSTIN